MSFSPLQLGEQHQQTPAVGSEPPQDDAMGGNDSADESCAGKTFHSGVSIDELADMDTFDPTVELDPNMLSFEELDEYTRQCLLEHEQIAPT